MNEKEGIYSLDGKIKTINAIPYGFEHALVMIISNISAMLIILGLINDDSIDKNGIIQNSLFISGIATIIQAYGIGKIGAKLPLVMGTSFGFISVLGFIGSKYGYYTVITSCIIGGLIIGVLGFFQKFWKKLVNPLVSGLVVIGIGFTLLSVGTKSFAGGEANPNYGSWQYLLIGFVSFISCLLVNLLGKGMLKNLSVLIGIAVGYILSIIMKQVDFSLFNNVNIITYPKLVDFSKLNIEISSIISIVILYIASTTDSFGNIFTISHNTLEKEVGDEVSKSISLTGFASALAGVFGTFPLTSYGENVSLINSTKVVNRKCFLWAGIIIILCSLFPVIGVSFQTIPVSVIGGSLLYLFASIILTGIKMVCECGFSQRNIFIISVTIAIGLGLPMANAFDKMPDLIKAIGSNYIIMMFITSLILSLVLPKEKETKNLH